MEDDILTLGEQFGNNGMNNNAFSYQPVPSAPLPTESMYPDWVNDIKSPNISKDITPEINNIVQDIRYGAMDSLQTKGKSGSDSILNEMFPNKIQTQYDVPITDTHELLSDGKTWIPKYKTYLPGANNEVLNASQQSNWEKTFNPIKRFGVKVGRGIVGDIGSFVYGIGEAAITGRAESVFDNGMSNYIDDLDKKTDFKYKNYYTEAQNGLGANLYTWDKILGGAEFTARMLGAEAIIAAATGGASLPASFARTGARLGLETGSKAFKIFKTAETLEDVAEIGAQASKINKIIAQPVVNVANKGGGVFSAERYAQGLQSAISAGNKADLLKQARFAVTGSMYESGFEARHYQNEAENTFWDYYRQKGIQPSQEEIDNFYNKLDDTAWVVFGSNMAILSTSNMALFGNMMNIKNPFKKLTDGSFIDKSIFKIGTEKTTEGLWKPIKTGFFNKAAAYTAPIVRGAAIEGVYEEGTQGIASNMMKNYIASTYDPKAMKETSDYMSSFTKAFKDQYSTKEGIEEIVIGGIIGGLFGGVHAVGEVKNDYAKQGFVAQVQNVMPQVADNIVSNLYTNESLSNIIGHANRLQGIGDRQNTAKINGDVVGDAMHSAESFISMLQASSSVGKTDEFLNVLKASLTGMDPEQIAEGQNIKIEDVEAFKAEKIAGVEKLSEDYAKAREAATFLFGRGNIGGFHEIQGQKINKSNLIDAFAYTSTMGSVSQQISSDAFNAFQQKLAEIGTDTSIVEQYGSIAALQTAGSMELARYTQATNDENKLSKQRKKLEDDLLKLQNQEITPDITQKLQEISNKLVELGSEINQANQNKDLYWKSIVNNFYKNLGIKGYLPQIDFDNFNNNINSLQEALDNSSLAEYDKLELNKLLDEFDKSNEAYKSFNKLAQTLANPKFTFKIYNNIFSGFRAKSDKSLNDITKIALTDLYNTDTKIKETLTSFQPKPSLVTDDVIKSMNDDLEYQLPQDILNDVRNKVKDKISLSENEQQVYNRFKNEIDNSINAINEDPINVNTEEAEISSITVKISALRNEINELENDVITSSIKNDINSINKKIDDLNIELNTSDVDKQEELNIEIASLQNDKQFIVNDRILDINDEINDLTSKEQVDKKLEIKKDRLSKRIEKLRENILDEIATDISKQEEDNIISNIDEKSNYKLKKLRKLESELKNLNNIREDFNPDASYVDQLQWILDNNSIIRYQNIDTLASVSLPSTEDISRYSDLVSKKRKSKVETAEMAELREKLLPYKILEGSQFGGIPLLDIINVYNQLNDIKTTENNQIEFLPEEEIQKAIYQVQTQEFTSEYRASNVGLVYDGTYLRGGGNIQRLFHIRLNTMLNAALNNDLFTTVTEFVTEKGNINYSEPIIVDTNNVTDIANKYDNFGGVRINIGDEIILEKSERGVNFNVIGDIASLLDLRPYAITGQPNSYNLLYEQKIDGSFAPKESEYQVTRNGNEIPFDKETLNKLKPGENVTLFFDVNDDYNQTLKPEEYASKGNIYVMKNGNLINILKANTNYETNDAGWVALANLREKIVKAGATNQTVTTSIKNSYLGLPIINIGIDGRAIEQPIIEELVLSYGYLDETGNYNFFDNVKVDNYQYTDPYKNLEKNVPIMAFKYNNRVYTFPIQIESQSINAEGELDNILNNIELNEYVKMFQVNSLLAKYNLDLNNLAWTIENNTIPAIREALTSVSGKVNIKNETDFKNANKSTLLNMIDPFMSAKLVLNIQTSEQILNEIENKTKENVIVKPTNNKGLNLAEDNMC